DIIAIGSPQAVLGKVLILQIQKKWELAAETAYHGSTEFPKYSAFYMQEAFSLLCNANLQSANAAIQRLEGIDIHYAYQILFPIRWLKAMIHLKNGDQILIKDYFPLEQIQ